MIRHGQIETEELEDRADQPLGLAQRQPEHRPERQGCADRQRRVMRLAASCCTRLSPPSRNGFLGEPDRETASLTQTGVVLGPIRDLVPLLRNAVTASGIGFEWHGRESLVRGRTGLYATQPRLPTRLSMQQSAAPAEEALKLQRPLPDDMLEIVTEGAKSDQPEEGRNAVGSHT